MPDIRSFHFQKWTKEYESNLVNGVKKAFEAAEEKFEAEVGTRYYSSFESFKSSRTCRRKTRKKRGF